MRGCAAADPAWRRLGRLSRWAVAAAAPVVLLCGCPSEQRANDAAAVAAVGRLTVTSIPAGAAVLRDGRRRLGRTPLTLERPAGSRVVLVLAKDGYQPLRRSVMIEAGTTREVLFQLVPQQGHVMVRTGARGARITIDGEDRGRTPAKVPVPIGEHHLVVHKDGFQRYSERVRVRDGETVIVDVPLVAAGHKRAAVGWLSIASDVPALVRIDGKLIGSTPLERLPLSARAHRITLRSRAAGRSRELQLTIARGTHQRLDVELR